MRRFIQANLWALIPFLLAVAIVGIARNVMLLPGDCDGSHTREFLCVTDARYLAAAAETGADGPARIAVAARLGTAWTTWAAAYGAMVSAAIAAIIGSAWLIFGAFHQYVVVHNKAHGSLRYAAGFIGGTFVVVGGLYSLLLDALFRLFRTAPPLPWSLFNILDPRHTVAADGLMAVFLDDPAMLARIQYGIGLMLAAVIAIALLSAAVLFQDPAAPALRLPAADGQPQPGAIPDDPAYVRMLARNFGRLRVGVYLGAALLVAVLGEIAARYAIPVATLADKSPAAQPLQAFAQQYVFGIAVAFSMLLAALYFPALSILRQRARDYHRARSPAETITQQETWLKENGFSIELSQRYVEVVAMLAPAVLAGPATKILGLVG